MMREYKIAILGIGGVGGYIGAKLAYSYTNTPIKISFLARGKNAFAIEKNGLKLITDNSEIIAFLPTIAFHASELKNIDLFIVCTKTYQLEGIIRSILPGNENALFLVLLNGVDAIDKIRNIHSTTRVVNGCIYLSSRRITPGVIRQAGAVNQIYFGSDLIDINELKFIEETLRGAQLNATLSDNISIVCWEKFFFISPIATLTSYLNLTIGEIVKSEDNRSLLIELMKELKLIADAKGIGLDPNIIDSSVSKATTMPIGATSSMHTDFQKGNQTELEALTGYVVKQGDEFGIQTPNYSKMYISLSQKNKP